MSKLRLAGTIGESIVDGPGLRFVIFAQGCPHHCAGCQTPQTFDPNGGYEEDSEKILKEIKSNPLLQGVTFSGGEPFMQARRFAELAEKIHDMNLNVMVYTGYLFEDLLATDKRDARNFLQNIDILVDGPFVKEKKNLLLKFKGSENQRIIDVKSSLEKNKIIVVG